MCDTSSMASCRMKDRHATYLDLRLVIGRDGRLDQSKVLRSRSPALIIPALAGRYAHIPIAANGSQFTIVIFIHYKPQIVVAILDL